VSRRASPRPAVLPVAPEPDRVGWRETPSPSGSGEWPSGASAASGSWEGKTVPRRILPRKSGGPPCFSSCRLILPLSPLHPLYRLLMFDTPTLALAQIVSMTSERRLNISLIISTKSLDLPFKRITLRTGHPILTSLAPQKRPSLKGRTPTVLDGAVSAVEVLPHHRHAHFLGATVPCKYFF
jgi:hypothetical protein